MITVLKGLCLRQHLEAPNSVLVVMSSQMKQSTICISHTVSGSRRDANTLYSATKRSCRLLSVFCGDGGYLERRGEQATLWSSVIPRGPYLFGICVCGVCWLSFCCCGKIPWPKASLKFALAYGSRQLGVHAGREGMAAVAVGSWETTSVPQSKLVRGACYQLSKAAPSDVLLPSYPKSSMTVTNSAANWGDEPMGVFPFKLLHGGVCRMLWTHVKSCYWIWDRGSSISSYVLSLTKIVLFTNENSVFYKSSGT